MIMIKYRLIFTDLDDTLLDHYTYSFKPASRLLAWLSQHGIPVIINSSKSFAEVVRIREKMGNTDPFIVENGAAIYLPKHRFPRCPENCSKHGSYWFYSIVRPREHWLTLMHGFDSEFSSLYTGMSEMSIEEIEEFTGLSSEDANYAARRQFSEALYWHGRKEDKKLFIQTIEGWGGYVLEGGRFLHVGDRTSKGSSMQWLCRCYDHYFPSRQFQTYALGDSPNDLDMLNCADWAVVVASPGHPAPKLERTEQVVYTKKYGPQGWTDSLMKLFNIPEHALPEIKD